MRAAEAGRPALDDATLEAHGKARTVRRRDRRVRLLAAMDHAMPECARFIRAMDTVFGTVEIVEASENRIHLDEPLRLRR